LLFERVDKTFPNKLPLTEKLSPRSSQRCIAELANFKPPDRPLKPNAILTHVVEPFLLLHYCHK